jgi:serine/threonine protein kinase
MAPEIFDRDYHWEADMWSLGIMLYQLYARRFPYWSTYEECR